MISERFIREQVTRVEKQLQLNNTLLRLLLEEMLRGDNDTIEVKRDEIKRHLAEWYKS